MNILSPPTTFHYRHYKITTTKAVQQPSPSPPPPEPLTETETPVRFGILGCAGVARKVSRGIKLAPNASLYAVGSRSHDKAVQFAAANGLPPEAKIYGSYDGLLDDPDVDAIYAPLPTGLHVKWAVQAAQKKKHVMLEKPAALNVSDLDIILEACEANGVQFMDGTMFVHHPRTAKMKEFLNEPERFGQLQSVNSIFTFRADPYYIEHNIRTKPELDGLGALGDVGWYCIRAILWATDYELPKSVIALHGAILNKAGVIMSCRASLHWEDGRVATIHCSFLENLTMDVTAIGSRGTLRLDDFNIPLEETKASFSTTTDTRYNDLATEWVSRPSQQTVFNDLPQESLQVKEFSRLVHNIKNNGAKPEKWWSMVSRKTQVVTDAVVKSINNGFEVVELT